MHLIGQRKITISKLEKIISIKWSISCWVIRKIEAKLRVVISRLDGQTTSNGVVCLTNRKRVCWERSRITKCHKG